MLINNRNTIQRCPTGNSRNTQTGVALILCLVLAAVFSAISIYTSEKEQQQLRVFMGLQERVEQHYLAHSLMQQINYSVLANKEFIWQGETIELNGFSEVITLRHPYSDIGYITISMQDVLGMMAVTAPNSDSFVKVIDNLSEEAEGQRIMDTWYDWEDKDNLARLNGKEDDILSTVPYKPRNDKFQVLSELRLIDGMDENLFNKLEPHLVYLQPFDFDNTKASNELREFMGLNEITSEMRKGANFSMQNGLIVEQLQSFKVRLDIQGDHARFQRQYVVTYRPDEVRLVSISEFGD